ncbi:unnamed protein product [Mytilus coruscus]|uniref:Uncharacterized protein n=1 Tax=Mytilus coruscus TaxID=42192 RepID=A0A6J8CDY9_MYTCO|nr:unnamed protein product [Mytilus coruscus]
MSLDTTDLVKLAHCAIELANESTSRADSTNRAGDLGSLLTDQFFVLPENNGIVIQLTKGKLVDIRDPRVVVVLKTELAEFCPVQMLQEYVTLCDSIGFNLKLGYAFRLLDSYLKLSSKPLSSSTANARLKLYLTKTICGREKPLTAPAVVVH